MIRKTLTLVAVLASSICFAHEANNTMDNGLNDEIAANKNQNLLGSSDERIILGSYQGVQDEVNFVSCPKTYVEPHQIAFYENGIFIQINDLTLETDSINTDGDGLYFERIRDDGCGYMQWKCDKEIRKGVACNTCNWIWHSACTTCRRLR